MMGLMRKLASVLLCVCMIEANLTDIQDVTTTRQPQTTNNNMPIHIAPDVCNMSLASEGEAQVKCDCQDIEVDCSYLEVTDLPNLISFPKRVHHARFKGNKIGSILSETFYNGRDILSLDLSYNRIDFISVDGFRAFTKLTNLDISHNRLWHIPKEAFQGLTSLRRLDLSHNDMRNLFSHAFKNLPNLRELFLEANRIHLEPLLFEHLGKLEVLNLDSALIRVIPDHMFTFTPRLRFLSLANNHLHDVPTDALKVLRQVSVLKLSGNPIETVSSEAFLGMSGMVVLYLDEMIELKTIEDFAFGDMEHLQELHCSYNYLLSTISDKAFVKKSNLEKVHLSQLFLKQNKLNSIPWNLLDWSPTVELHLNNNPLNCDCNIKWMIHLKLKNSFQNSARCSSPDHLKRKSLSDLKTEDEITCGLQLSDVFMIRLALSLTIVFLFAVIVLGYILWKRSYFSHIKWYFRLMPQKTTSPKVVYRDEEEIYVRS